MPLRTAEETATLIALIFERSGQARIRISQKTIKFLGYRYKLRSAFVVSVTEALSSYYDITMLELDTGAFGLIRTSSLEGAKAFTAKRMLEELLPDLRKGKALDFDAIEKEISKVEDLDLED